MGCIYSNTNKVDPVDEETYRKALTKSQQENIRALPRVSQEEAIVLEQLRNEGLLSGPTLSSSGGVSFQIMDENHPGLPQRLPRRLEKLDVANKEIYSHEKIKAKLERAEQRRKEREEQQVIKLHTQSQGKVDAVEKIRKIQKEKEEMTEKRIETVEENRERKLQEIRDRMKERQKYRDEVRRRKSLKKDGDAQ